MINIILCGGSGTRLWPLSRKLMPKQFLKLFNDKSLFQLTIERNQKITTSQIVVSNEEQYFIALDQVEEIGESAKFLLESVAKNTAPAIALACMELDSEDIVLVTPSDHLIKNEEEYKKVVNKAKELAQENYLVTFGIKPTEANTGYGYIEADGFDVVKFHEKPELKKAKEYLEKGNYYWNSGMFCFKAGVFLDELKEHSPEIYESVKEAYKNRKTDNNQTRIPFEYMEKIVEDSIDYAVMEKSKKVKVIPSDIGWSDVGSFDSLVDEIESKEAIEINSKNSFYYTDTKDKVIATIGLEDFIVVDTKDALLITKKNQTQKVKEIVNQIKTTHYQLLTTHSLVHRPWGTYETLIDDNGYKIKRIIVKPGKRLSLQKHFHRNEHWIVVSGTAKVTVGKEEYLVRPNESTYIKMGKEHRLENPGKIPVVLIEAQVGEYTGEDDIIRISDDYKREKNGK
jgi:mannose-1-phosphate guanylyltransferase